MIVGSKKNISNNKESVRKLRLKGLSYREIQEKIPVSKSTISLWCRNVRLGDVQRDRLRKKRDSSLKGIRAIQKMFWQRRCDAFEKGVQMVERMHADTDFIGGLMLYWAEGSKAGHVILTHSDVRIILFMIRWFHKYFDVSPQHIRINLHLYAGQNERNMKQYWSEMTGVPVSNFQKTRMKREGLGYKRKDLYRGTVRIRVKRKGSTYMLFHILGAIAGYFKKTLKMEIIPEEWMMKLPYA